MNTEQPTNYSKIKALAWKGIGFAGWVMLFIFLNKNEIDKLNYIGQIIAGIPIGISGYFLFIDDTIRRIFK